MNARRFMADLFTPGFVGAGSLAARLRYSAPDPRPETQDRHKVRLREAQVPTGDRTYGYA